MEVTDGKDIKSETFTFTTVFEAPIVSNPIPSDGAEYIPLSLSHLNFTLVDYQNDLMDYTVETQPDIGSGSSYGVGDGTYSIEVGNLDYYTTYIWYINVTDGTYWMNKTFTFTTMPEGMIVLYPTDDSHIRHGSPDTNYGECELIYIRNDYGGGGSSGWGYNDLIKFDTTTIPENSTIQYAYLKLYYYKNKDNNPSGREIQLYKATSNWDEETVTWNTQPPYAAQPTTVSYVPSSIGTWMTWDVTSDILDFYQGFEENYGWKITDENYWGQVNIPITYYRSKEYGEYTPFLEIGINE